MVCGEDGYTTDCFFRLKFRCERSMGNISDRYWDRYGYEHADTLHSRANGSEVLSPPQTRSLRTDYINYSEIDAPIGNGILSLRIDIHSNL